MVFFGGGGGAKGVESKLSENWFLRPQFINYRDCMRSIRDSWLARTDIAIPMEMGQRWDSSILIRPTHPEPSQAGSVRKTVSARDRCSHQEHHD